jgi:hypothetical protein
MSRTAQRVVLSAQKGTQPPRPTVTSIVNSTLVALRDRIGKGDIAGF